MNTVNSDIINYCSFCLKTRDQVEKLIVGDSVGICNECVDCCVQLLDNQPVNKNITNVDSNSCNSIDPIELKNYLDQYVIGQDSAKVMLSVAIANHYKRINKTNDSIEINKANILMLGPTGSGKTLLAKTVANYLNVPFAIGDATSITESGYVGDDVESLISRLLQAADGDIEKTQKGIIFIDEIDKIGRKSESASITRDVSGEGVQQALLKLIEGTKCRIPAAAGRKHPAGEMIEIDTKDILFIAGGAFVGIDQIVKNRKHGTMMGFSASIDHQDHSEHEHDVIPDDLIKFGMIPELVGRFPNWIKLSTLTKDDLTKILTQVKNNFIDQYQWLLKQDQIELIFDHSAIEQIVENTINHCTGARGLQSEIERVLMPHMFNVYSYKNQKIKTLIIDDDLVNNPRPIKEIN
jgi:ATP-dependent Clp protease ATP-binding subunit ClpX